MSLQDPLLKKFICTDEHGRFGEYFAEDARSAIERHICEVALRAKIDVKDLATFEIEAHEVASTTKAMWRTWSVREAELHMKGQTK